MKKQYRTTISLTDPNAIAIMEALPPYTRSTYIQSLILGAAGKHIETVRVLVQQVLAQLESEER